MAGRHLGRRGTRKTPAQPTVPPNRPEETNLTAGAALATELNNRIRLNRLYSPLAWLYGLGVLLRNICFDMGWLKSRRFPLPVICVGNLAVGGTGKTPHVEYLIRLLAAEGFQVSTLSRGYKRKSKGFVLAGSKTGWREVGDEPAQIKNNLPETVVAADANRCQGIERLMKMENPAVDVVLLDDAYQHRYVNAGLNILLTDYHSLYDADALMPVGRLREPASRAGRADIVVVTKCPIEKMKPIDFLIVAKHLNLYSYQQLFFSGLRYGDLRPLFPDKAGTDPLVVGKDHSVLLLTGIASPQPLAKHIGRFTKHIRLIGFDDHHEFNSTSFHRIKKRFNRLHGQQRVIITTEKDATRLVNNSYLPESLKPYIYVQPVVVAFRQDQEKTFNQNILNYVRKSQRNS